MPNKKQKEFKEAPEKKVEPGAEEIKDFPEAKIEAEVEEKKSRRNQIIKAINYLNNKYDFRYNVINTDTEYRLKGTGEFRYFDDRDYNDVSNDLEIGGRITIPDHKFRSNVYSSSISKPYDPFKEYLFSLPKWDGKDYITEYLQQVYLVNEEDRQYFINGFKKWFVALVMSLVEDEPSPYKINQVCLVFVGDQGRYKTTFMKNIVPAHLQLKYFYGSTFQIHNKDHEKYLAYKILINLDEMAALNKTDIESIKSRITQDQIVVRLPYTKADVHLKRRASFCGSVNNPEYLRDDTGTRRFFTVEISNIVIDSSFNVDLMYAQGLALYKDGFKFWFEKEDIKKLEYHNQYYTQRSFEEDMLIKYYQLPDEEDIKQNFVEYVTATEIANYFRSKDNGININNTVIRNIGAALKKNGFKKTSRRINNNPNPRPLWVVKKVFEPKTYALDDATVFRGDEQGDMPF